MLKKKLFNFRPFLFCAVSITLGIVCAYLFYLNKTFLGVMTIGIFFAITASLVLFTGNEKRKKLIFSIFFCLLFAFGSLTFTIQLNSFATANLDSHTYEVTGKVVRTSKTEYGERLTLVNINITGDRTGKLKYNAYVYVNGEIKVDIGDVISFRDKLNDNNPIYENELLSSRVEQGVKYTASINAEQIKISDKSFTVFDRIHLFIRDALKTGLGEQEFSVAYAMLLGATEEMDYDLVSGYRATGVAHIFAVSGLHIGFLATALNFLFDKFKSKRLLKAIVVTVCVFFYSGVCGFTASSLRASVMTSVLLFSSIKGNRYDSLSSVGVACTLILLCSPVNLFCVGFQLSFAVVLGIILLSPPLCKILKFLPHKLASALSVVVSAQIFGIPICISAFGKFSTIAIIANILLIPIVSFLFVALILCALLGGFLGIEKITLFLPGYALKFINLLITAFDYEKLMVGGFIFGIFIIFYYL